MNSAASGKCVRFGGLILLVTGAWALSARAEEPDTKVSPATHVVEMHNNFFNPEVIEIAVGDTIVWVNKRTRRHTVTRTQEPETFDSGLLSIDETFQHTFSTVSPEDGYRYYCRPHADEMIGKVVVKERGALLAAKSKSGGCSPFDDPDAFAWKLFMEINHPADLNQGRGVPDHQKEIGSEGAVVWETWRMSPDEVYLDRGRDPGPWNSKAVFVVSKQLKDLRSPRKVDLLDTHHHSSLKSSAPSSFGQSAMNREAYEFIRANELYNIEGQEAFHQSNPPRLINFPIAAREIKSAWDILSTKPIDELTDAEIEEFKSAFHTTTVSDDGKEYLYGLKGLHIITKDLPNWVWATFEHKSNPRPELPDNDRHGLPAELEGTKWSNYRLRGVQLEFTDSAGQATVLANTQMEAEFQQSSSCITCHALATIGDRDTGSLRANRLPFFHVRKILHRRPNGDQSDQEFVYGDIGVPDPTLFQLKSGKRLYTQLDFVWSLRFARSKNE